MAFRLIFTLSSFSKNLAKPFSQNPSPSIFDYSKPLIKFLISHCRLTLAFLSQESCRDVLVRIPYLLLTFLLSNLTFMDSCPIPWLQIPTFLSYELSPISFPYCKTLYLDITPIPMVPLAWSLSYYSLKNAVSFFFNTTTELGPCLRKVSCSSYLYLLCLLVCCKASFCSCKWQVTL